MMPETSPAAPIAWPVGKTAAASFTFDVDAESAVLFGAPGSEKRAGVMSHQSYGPLAGVPRILSILDRIGIRATFFTPGYTALRYPSVVRDIVAAGHEIAHHGFMHETLEGVDEPTERRYLQRGLEVDRRIAGGTGQGQNQGDSEDGAHGAHSRTPGLRSGSGPPPA